MYINLMVWLIFVVVMVVGHLTYADYYTKLNKDLVEWIITGIVILVFATSFNFALMALVSVSVTEGFKYCLWWFTGITCLYYLIGIVLGIGSGYTNLREYFGKKRGKV